MVGALLCSPDDPACATAVLFFNNEGYLNMCGHGTIGVAVTMAHLQMIDVGAFKIQTPAGIVSVELHNGNEASFTNVESYVLATNVQIKIDGIGNVSGHIAYGGNWFFVCDAPCPLLRQNRQQLLSIASRLRDELSRLRLDGFDTGKIDHVQFFESDVDARSSRNFVVCPGGEFDRSPCGTGTSAVLALMAEMGHLQESELWTQESLTGGVFQGSFEWANGEKTKVTPTVRGKAFVCSEATLLQHPEDPYRFGNEIRVLEE